MVRQHYKSIPAISKYFYKDSSNDTVKGFDAVHVVQQKDEFELWLGEVKFYKQISSAIADVVAELKLHSERNYLRSEFIAITNKLDESWEGTSALKELLHQNNSIDKIFKRICIPVLLTYESKVLDTYKEVSTEYKKAFEEEVLRHRDTFAGKELPQNVTVHLFLFPLHKKENLLKKFDEVLKAWQ
jgi:hypothetical protein